MTRFFFNLATNNRSRKPILALYIIAADFPFARANQCQPTLKVKARLWPNRPASADRLSRSQVLSRGTASTFRQHRQSINGNVV